jgi:hypothetical protein
VQNLRPDGARNVPQVAPVRGGRHEDFSQAARVPVHLPRGLGAEHHVHEAVKTAVTSEAVLVRINA